MPTDPATLTGAALDIYNHLVFETAPSDTLKPPFLTTAEIARSLDYDPSTVRTHARRLVEDGLLETGVVYRAQRGQPPRAWWLAEYPTPDLAVTDAEWNAPRRSSVLRTTTPPRPAPLHAGEILATLRQQGPRTATQLREELNVSGDVARANLDHLLATGKIRAERRPTGKRGKPPTYYHAT